MLQLDWQGLCCKVKQKKYYLAGCGNPSMPGRWYTMDTSCVNREAITALVITVVSFNRVNFFK